MSCELIQISVSLLKDVKLEQARGDHFTFREQSGLLFCTLIISLPNFILLYDAESVHFSLRSFLFLLHLEAGDPDRSFFIRVALAKPEDVLLKDKILRAEHLPLQVCSEFLWLRDARLVLELEEHEVRANGVLLRRHDVPHLAALDDDFQVPVVRLLLRRGHGEKLVLVMRLHDL